MLFSSSRHVIFKFIPMGLRAIYALGIASLFPDDQAIDDMQFAKKIEAQR